MTQSPIGVVCEAVNKREVKLVTAQRHLAHSADCHVACIELHPTDGSEAMEGSGEFKKGGTGFQNIPKNEAGGFWQIYQLNRWLLVRERAAATAPLAAVAGPMKSFK